MAKRLFLSLKYNPSIIFYFKILKILFQKFENIIRTFRHYKKRGVWAAFFWAAFFETRPKNA